MRWRFRDSYRADGIQAILCIVCYHSYVYVDQTLTSSRRLRSAGLHASCSKYPNKRRRSCFSFPHASLAASLSLSLASISFSRRSCRMHHKLQTTPTTLLSNVIQYALA